MKVKRVKIIIFLHLFVIKCKEKQWCFVIEFQKPPVVPDFQSWQLIYPEKSYCECFYFLTLWCLTDWESWSQFLQVW